MRIFTSYDALGMDIPVSETSEEKLLPASETDVFVELLERIYAFDEDDQFYTTRFRPRALTLEPSAVLTEAKQWNKAAKMRDKAVRDGLRGNTKFWERLMASLSERRKNKMLAMYLPDEQVQTRRIRASICEQDDKWFEYDDSIVYLPNCLLLERDPLPGDYAMFNQTLTHEQMRHIRRNPDQYLVAEIEVS